MNKTLLTIFLISTVTCISCKPREQNLDNLMHQLVNMGYTGKFEMPETSFEKAALSMFGVDDYLAFEGADNEFVVISFKSEDKVISEERLESLIKLVENNISDSDREGYHITKENWKEHVYQNKNYIVAWSQQRPTEVLEIVGGY